MVYPENLVLDQAARKTARNSTSSWCSEPLTNKSNAENEHVQSNPQANGEKDNSAIAEHTGGIT